MTRLRDLPRADDWWAACDVSEHAGISESTINSYVANGEMPAPSHRIGGNRVWRPEVIREWHATRPRVSGRHRNTAA